MTHSTPNDGLLKFARLLIFFIQGILALVVTALLAAIPGALLSKSHIAAEISPDASLSLGATLGAIVAVLALGALVLGLAFIFFQALRQIVDTVGQGDPFTPANARRLTTMGWLTIAIQALIIPLAGIGLLAAKAFEEQNLTIDASFDLGAIILAVTLFILARVFRQGAAMREDLEGTV